MTPMTGQESEYAIENTLNVPAGEDWLDHTNSSEPSATFVVQIGSIRIADDSLRGKPHETIRKQLKMAYPEVDKATVTETTDSDTGVTTLKFNARPGRKG